MTRSASGPDGHDDKVRLRSWLRERRDALEPADRAAQSRDLARHVLDHVGSTIPPSGDGARSTIAAYLGVAPEPDTIALLTALAPDHDIVVPICEPRYQLSWAAWTPGTPLERSVRAPVGEPGGRRFAFTELTGVRLILVPALGIDEDGQRVGQGGGYYDRFLSDHPHDAPDAVPRLGIVYRSELLPAGRVPARPYDQPLHGAFTADGLRLFGERATPV